VVVSAVAVSSVAVSAEAVSVEAVSVEVVSAEAVSVEVVSAEAVSDVVLFDSVESVVVESAFSVVSLEVLEELAGGANLIVFSNKGTILTLILYLVIPLPGKVGLLKVRKYSEKSSGFTTIANANGSL
jgi:hypothetical protein